MRRSSQAKLLRIHLSEGDKRSGRPLYEAIVDKCRELGIAGATVFRGLEGFGETADVHRHHLLLHDQPILIVIVDEAEALSRLIPEVEAMMVSGMMALSDVRTIRVNKSSPDV